MAGSNDAVIRIGTRGSLLATTQAGTIRDQLIERGHRAELVIISTEGDRSQKPVAEIGIGVFTAALREAIADGRVDMAVHSYKDLPTAPDDRFVIAATPHAIGAPHLPHLQPRFSQSRNKPRQVTRRAVIFPAHQPLSTGQPGSFKIGPGEVGTD